MSVVVPFLTPLGKPRRKVKEAPPVEVPSEPLTVPVPERKKQPVKVPA